MSFDAGRSGRRLAGLAAAVAAAFLLASCGNSPQPMNYAGGQKRTKEYFAESVWGVKASPRVTNLATNLPRGGGREQVGRPYQVRGEWYHPREEPDYRKVGMASWYGDAFHGRLTANGEVYDMTHLTAAHPTMPLPSYARVTNLDNGNSVIVRVNDRGPFTQGRIIDLSSRAAELLDYKRSGVAQVEVEYVGRAPLHGQDDAFLMASYRPGSGGYDGGTMIAMNGSTPTGARDVSHGIASSFAGTGAETSLPSLPSTISVPSRRPMEPVIGGVGEPAPLAYAEARMGSGSPFEALLGKSADVPSAIVTSWIRRNRELATAPSGPHVAVGTFASRQAAEQMAERLGQAGEVLLSPVNGGMAVLAVSPNGRMELDDIVRVAWAAGAADAFVVRE